VAFSRGRGVIRSSSSAYPAGRSVNDGGHDAPLTPRGRTMFRVAMLTIVAVGFVLVIITVHSH
jgi:hypothetical protein